ncbi:O-antigen ligase family protein [Amycolatopsis sp. H20-H5]|uniref:O-antigen ligase family protein n=1 Tax=Amycolatopsis sp. H20-H5 TaxID=3046309 RepID=UPI002DB9B0D8|nr:O-antigen ligase family protein [Amycolatopsis sp. H20-H5]MEC3977318.1 O-antigen ligase family protein [Amycolatopsis sp. H20-H5]
MTVDATFVVATAKHRRSGTGTPLLQVFACATVALAPLEGYLISVQGQLAKLAPMLLALTWIVVRVRQRRLPRAHPVQAVLALFAVVLLGSAAAHAAGPFTVDYTLRWLPFLAITVVLADVAAAEVPIRALLIAAVGGATVAGSGALYSLIVEGETRASGPLADPNDLAYFLVAALPLLIVVTPARPSPHRRLFGVLTALAAIVLAAGAAATFSRGGALALVAAVSWLVLRRVLPVRVLAVACGVLAALGLLAVLLAGQELTKALQEKSYIAATNVDTRELRWQAAARMLTDNPLLGVGPGGFRGGYAAASHNAEIDEQTPVAHNMYLEVAAELGVGGFALFLAVLATAAVAAERTLRLSADRREMVAVQASLLAVVVASTFLSEQYYLPLWSMVALACAAEVRSRLPKGSGDARPARDQ